MVISKTIMTNKQGDWYIQILEWCVDHALVWTTFLLGFTAIDKTFKEIRKRREASEKLELERHDLRMRQIVQEEITKGVLMRLDKIAEKVDDLNDAFIRHNIKK
jgi:hypothetical protein